MAKARNLHAALLFAVLLVLGMGCELIAGVDRGKIDASTGGGGTGGTTTTSTGGGGATTGGGGTGGVTGGTGGVTGGTGGITGGTGGVTGGGGTGGITGGTGGTGGMMCVPVDDNNECTDDICDANNLPAHVNKDVGTACVNGGSQCDGNGNCVECLAPSDCPGQDNACQTRTCDAGVCGFDFVNDGTPLPTQTAGDCKLAVCDGFGGTASAADDTDVPDDNNACTNDICAAGAPGHTSVSQGTSCGGVGSPLVCDGAGSCVGCNGPSDCAGTDDECKQRTCVNQVCGVAFTAANTPVAAQTGGDCLKHVCDGSGNFAQIADDTDVPADDGNACTADTCTAGAPVHPNKANGTGCNDSDSCTQTDTCQQGACTGGNPVVCAAQDQCHDAGTCNPGTGFCSNPIKANGSTCSDGDSCTQTDTCQAGACTGANPVTCAAQDQCHIAGVCNPATGVCSNPNKADGTTCSDGDSCTQTDTCQAGACTGANPVTCTASDQCHDAGTCNPANGTCSNPAKADGATCNDNDACTQTDTCQAGACSGGNPKTCTASDQCHDAGTCNPANGTCSNPAKADGATCNDGDACTQTDTCQAGACTGANPKTCTASDQCHDAGTCNPANGTCSNPAKADGVTCNDNDACTQTDTCQAGACSGGDPKTCTASDQCHDAGTCNPANGTCSNPAKADGATCNDNDACTQTDTCQAGACSGGNPKTCAASDQCHAAGTCAPATGTCSDPNQPDGTACVNGGVSGACVAGVCGTCGDGTTQAGEQCDDGNPINGDGCDVNCTTSACGNGALAPSEQCDDGNLVSGDGCDANCKITACGNGVLTAGELCDDGNLVSGDGCDANCTPTICGNGIATLGEACDDGNAANGDGCDNNCTVTACGNGIVTGSEACDDGNAVNGDGCDNNCKATACGNGIVTGSEACDDGNAVNGDGCDNNCKVTACGNGIVTAGEACDDGNLVSGDGCDANCKVTACGNSIITAGEQCDDGNLVNSDGCNATCKIDEIEPNNTSATATNVAIVANAGGIYGAIATSTDVDYFKVTLTQTASIKAQTFDGSGAGTCSVGAGSHDTKIFLYATNGTTELANNDEGGVTPCSLIDPATTAAARLLAPGTYFIKVQHWNLTATIASYRLQITLVPCGDGTKETYEPCDDGNVNGSDGCSSACAVEAGYGCAGSPSVCQLQVCGNGVLETGQLCDDNNTVSGDGCSATCVPESGFTCTGTPSVCTTTCGDGIKAGAEACDDANVVNGDCCSSTCQLEGGCELEPNNTAATANPLPLVAATGTVKGGIATTTDVDYYAITLSLTSSLRIQTFDGSGAATCSVGAGSHDTKVFLYAPNGTTELANNDDGGVSPCSLIDPATLPGAANLAPGTYYVKVQHFAQTATIGVYRLVINAIACGDGAKDATEACDDGNLSNADGCSSVCAVEQGYTCTGSPSACTFSCGNGTITGAEGCDDNNLVDGDGCNSTCAVEFGFTCTGAPSACTFTCGNGNVTGAEQCDDGNLAPGDGCSPACLPEAGYACEGVSPNVCGPICGNSDTITPETCDDGNTGAGDGCDSACTTQTNLTEIEPNDTVANADTQAGAGVLINGLSTVVSGTVSTTTDKDITKFVLAADGVVRMEVFDSSGVDCTSANVGAAMKLSLLNSAGTLIVADTSTSGIGNCPELLKNLTAGTYYLQVEKTTGTLANYKLEVKVQTNKGNESEVNDTRAASDGVAGSDVYVFGGHQVSADLDVFAISVPAGKSIRAETIEGNAETCEGLGIDSRIRLFNAAGTDLGNDSDAGRGFCSMIDGTGATPLNPFAHNLPAGIYYLQVEAHTPGSASDVAMQFDYRLVVTVR